MTSQDGTTLSAKNMNILDLAPHRQRARRQEEQRQQHEQDNKNTPLLKLSAELRNEIFALALPSDQVFTTSFRSHKLLLNGEERKIPIVSNSEAYKYHFGLTQVCRQIRAETLQVAYASNTFILGNHSHARKNGAVRWAESRPQEALKSISKIIVHSGSGDWGYGCGDVNVAIDLESGAAELLENECSSCSDDLKIKEKVSKVMAHAFGQSTSPKEKLMKLPEMLHEELERYYWSQIESELDRDESRSNASKSESDSE